MSETLRPLADRDWSVRAGTLDWSCRETLAHIGHDLLAYAAQLAGSAQHGYLPLDLVIRPEAELPQALAAVEACAGLLITTLRSAEPDTRAWHFGPYDAGGFATLGIAEILIHSYDITQGLQVAWWPPAELSAVVVARLIADPPPGQDPTETLLRHTRRIGDPGEWHWRIEPRAS